TWGSPVWQAQDGGRPGDAAGPNPITHLHYTIYAAGASSQYVKNEPRFTARPSGQETAFRVPRPRVWNGGTLGTVERLEWWNAGGYPLSTSTRVLPSRAGEGDTLIPAASMAAILDSASPLPPEMMAPACPMRRPGGAVRPAMKPTIGFLRPRLASSIRNWAASSSAAPPISPIITIASVARSARNISRISMNSVPLTGSPPMPAAVVWPSPSWVVWNTAS